MASGHVELRDGVYYIPGTRISLDSIVCAFHEGCSPESIREDFEGLTLADITGRSLFTWTIRPISTLTSRGAKSSGLTWSVREIQ